MSEKREKPIASIVSIVLAVVLIIGSSGWLISNVDDALGWFPDRDDPVPTETVIPDDEETAGNVEAVLYAECQEQLRDALEGIGPRPSDRAKEANAEYLAEARNAQIQMRDLVSRGELLFDELTERDGDTNEEYVSDWNRRAQEFRIDLYDSIARLRKLGMGDGFARIQSELFLAYQWLDRYSDQINGFFSSQNIESISNEGLIKAVLHLDTARELLNR